MVDKNEAWVFHVLGDDTGSSAVWAAQRVPDDHVAAIANQVSEDVILFLFLIHQSSHVNQSIKSFIYSDNFMYPLID